MGVIQNLWPAIAELGGLGHTNLLCQAAQILMTQSLLTLSALVLSSTLPRSFLLHRLQWSKRSGLMITECGGNSMKPFTTQRNTTLFQERGIMNTVTFATSG